MCFWDAQPRPALCDPWTVAPPGSSVHGILQARMLEWAVVSFLGIPTQGSNLVSWVAGRSFTVWATKEAAWGQRQWPVFLGNSARHLLSLGLQSFWDNRGLRVWGLVDVGRWGQGGHLGSQKQAEQLEAVNLNVLLSSNGYHWFVLHLPHLFVLLWATWGVVKETLF